MHTPSTDRQSVSDERLSRRQLVAATATGVTTALAGCGAVLGGTDPRSLNPPDVIEDRPTTRVWEFPRGASDENTPIQAYLDQETRVPSDDQSADVRFTFGATVFGHSEYHHDRIALRLRAPAFPDSERTPADIFVQPLRGGFTSFRTYVDEQDTVIRLSDLETDGTLQFAFVVTSRTQPTPETLGYEFEIRGESGGTFGGSVDASDHGEFSIVREGESPRAL